MTTFCICSTVATAVGWESMLGGTSCLTALLWAGFTPKRGVIHRWGKVILFVNFYAYSSSKDKKSIGLKFYFNI